MSRRIERRSTAAPMDFEFTDARKELPLDSPFRRGIEAATAEKRSRVEMESPQTEPYSFGSRPSNVPFLFNVQPPPTSRPAWTLPDMPDVQMKDASPVRPSEETEETMSRPINLGAVKRVRRHREKQISKWRRNLVDSDHESDANNSDDDRHQPIRLAPQSTHYTLNMHNQNQGHTNLPYLLLGYTQVIFNSSLILLFLYLLISFIRTVQHDVEHRIKQYTIDSMQEITLCSGSYSSNNCENPLPALILQCLEWETCMAKDPSVVGRAKVGAEMLAEVINSFVEPISWKTLLFTLSSTAFFTVFVNAVINLYRSKHQPQDHLINYPNPVYSRGSTPIWWPQTGTEELPPRRRKLLDGNSVKVP